MARPVTLPLSCPVIGNKLFADLDGGNVKAAARECTPLRLVDGARVFDIGEIGECLYLIEFGTVRIFRTNADGSQEVLATMGPGDYFGEMALLGNHLRSASALVEGDTILHKLPLDAFQTLLDNEPELSRNLLDNAHRHLREIDERYLTELIQRDRLSMVGRMAASIIHDFKGPLTAIRGLAELMGEDDPRPESQRRTQMIVREVDRLVGMAHDVLDYSRSTKNLQLQPVSLEPFLVETLALLKLEFQRRSIAIDVLVKASDPVMLDVQRFQRVLYNLALNAAEAMDKGGRITLTVEREAEFVRLDVSDTGCGIPPSLHAQIWQPFVSFGKKGGNGLGLPIAKKVVEDHGGTITLHSEVGHGTTFSIRLPLPQN